MNFIRRKRRSGTIEYEQEVRSRIYGEGGLAGNLGIDKESGPGPKNGTEGEMDIQTRVT